MSVSVGGGLPKQVRAPATVSPAAVTLRAHVASHAMPACPRDCMCVVALRSAGHACSLN